MSTSVLYSPKNRPTLEEIVARGAFHLKVRPPIYPVANVVSYVKPCNLPSKRVEINSTSAFEAMNTSKPPKGFLCRVVPIEHAYPNMLGPRDVQVTEMLRI